MAHMLFIGIVCLLFPAMGHAEETTDSFLEEMLNLPGLEEESVPTETPQPQEVPEKKDGPPAPPAPEAPAPAPPPITPEVKEETTAPPPTEAEKAAELGSQPTVIIPAPPPPATKQPSPLFPIRTADVFWTGSIMYNAPDYRQLRQAIAIFERINQGTSLSTSYAGSIIPTIQEKSPAFSLNSIVYFSKDNWTVWLNDKKYTIGATLEGDFDIVDVTRDRVHLLWKPGLPLDQVAPGWQGKLVLSDSGDYVSHDREIWVNSAGSEIHFFLQPNQTFETAVMEIIEGIRKPDDFSSLPRFGTN